MTQKDMDARPWGSRLRQSKAFAVYVTCLAFLTDSLIYGVVVPLLPTTLVSRAGLRGDQIQLWNSILLAVFSGATLIGSFLFGWLSSKLSHLKWLFLTGQVMLAASTLLFALTTSVPILVIARLLQGLSNAVVWTLGYVLLYDSVELEQFGRIMGYAAMSNSIGIFLGPIIGGVLYSIVAYEVVFLLPLILIVICAVLRFLVIDPPRRDQQKEKPLTERQCLLTSSGCGHRDDLLQRVDSGTAYLSEHHRADVSKTPRNISGARSEIVTCSLTTLLCDARFDVALFGVFSVNGITTAFEGVLPVYVFERFKFDPTQSALLFLCITIPMLLSPITGWVVDNIGPKWPACIGWFIASISLCLLQLVEMPDSNQLAILIILLIIFGFSVAFVLTPMNAEVTIAVESLKRLKPDQLRGGGANALAFGIQTAAFATGCLIGPIYAGLIRQYFGWPAMALALGAIAGIMAILSLVFTGGSSCKERKRASQSCETLVPAQTSH